MLNLNIYSFLMSLEMMILVLVGVAFITLFERKLLSYIHIRKGPEKVGYYGLFQPFSDAIKLFVKEVIVLYKINFLYYLFSPFVMMLLMLLLWNKIPLKSLNINYSMNLLVIFCLLSMGVFSLMISGWSSGCIYSLIGGLRSIAQTISYEISMILIFMSVCLLVETFNLVKFMSYQSLWFVFFLMPLSLVFYISLLAELNRTPFDFVEAESELVSGFNTEYMSGSFAMIFIGEYGMLMFMMFIYMFIFLGGGFHFYLFYLIYMLMLFLIIWVRGTYPRMRYDELMFLTWKKYLPMSLNYLIMVLGVKMLLNY